MSEKHDEKHRSHIVQGCQWEVIKRGGGKLHFVVSLCVCVGDVQCPKGAMTEAQKGLRERNMSLYSVRNYLLRFRRISRVNISVQKKRISAIQQKIGIPDCYQALFLSCIT